MQSCQIVSQARIFTFNSCHVGFAHNLVAWWNKPWIDAPTIGDIEITVPCSNNCPQRFKGLRTVVAGIGELRYDCNE
jgi:hypothetical protein